MSSVVSGTSSSEVQHIPEELGPFHDPFLAGIFPLFAYILSSLLLALPINVFCRSRKYAAGYHHGGTVGDYEVKWNGPGLVQVSFLRGNKMILTARAIAAVAAGPHDGATVKVRAISEGSKALEGIVWKDVSLTFDTIHPF
jgi:hypothetical protein